MDFPRVLLQTLVIFLIAPSAFAVDGASAKPFPSPKKPTAPLVSGSLTKPAKVIIEIDERLPRRQYEVPPAVFSGTSARKYLEAMSVPFPPGASADYEPSTRRLVIRNLPENLDMIGDVVEWDGAVLAGKKEGEIAARLANRKRKIEETRQKLTEKIIPKFEVRELLLSNAIEMLYRETGVPVIIVPHPPARIINAETILNPEGALPPQEDIRDTRLTLSLTNVPANEVMRYLSTLGGFASHVESGFVIFVDTICGAGLRTDTYRVKPVIFGGVSPRDFFESRGVVFPAGSAINYQPSRDRLDVRNDREMLDLIETIIDELTLPPGAKRDSDADVAMAKEWKDIQNRELHMKEWMLRKVEFHEVTLMEAVKALREKLSLTIGACDNTKQRFSCSLANISTMDMLQKVGELTSTEVIVGLRGIAFVPKTK